MTDSEILDAVSAATTGFGVRCRKLSGAVTVEVLRSALIDAGLPVSRRDVYVKGLPFEFDLLIARPGASPLHDLIYDPSDVLAILEVKRLGCFGAGALATLQSTFRGVREACPYVSCAYVTLEERRGYTHAATEESLGFPAYTLFWYETERDRRQERQPTGDWGRLVGILQMAVTGSAG